MPHEAHALGRLREQEGQDEAALALWRYALTVTDDPTPLLNDCARLLDSLQRYGESEAYLKASLAETPDQPDVLATLRLTWQRTCRWEALRDLLADGDDCPGLVHYGSLALFDDIALQGRVAQAWLERHHPPAPERLAPLRGYDHGKIRVGYLSADFCIRPMSFLIPQVFEHHDRDQFEIYGYCSSVEDGSQVRRRVIGAFDHFHPIKAMNDEEAARLIRAHEIDLLIDLNGLSGGRRIGLLRWKPAPVQITYLGYIGPIPLPELDYILCDDYVIPPEVAPLYQPRPLSLGGVYQANDNKIVPGSPCSRESVGLPIDRFVYCCFAIHYKITERMFSAWLDILDRTPSSVLWLAQDNVWSEEALRAATRARGIAPERLIFARKAAHGDYLARVALADLFLDTSPYNTGTVASDVLRMGVPLLTVAGKSFAARMAGSLLTAVGLPDLIAPDLESYVAKAVALAQNQSALKRYRAVLEGGAWQRTLGDISGFVARLERAYRSVVKRTGVPS